MPLFGDKVSDKKLSDLVAPQSAPQSETRTEGQPERLPTAAAAAANTSPLTPPSPGLQTLARIRKQYPAYDDLSDQELARKIVSKYPQYEDTLGTIAAPPGFLARLQGRVTGEDPAAISQRGRKIAGSMERGGNTPEATLARKLGASEGTAESIGQFGQGLQAQLALPGSAAAGPLRPVSQAIGKVLNPATMLGRAATQAGVQGAQRAIETRDPAEIAKSAGIGALTQAGGDVAFKAGRALLSVIPKNVFENRTSRQLAYWLRENVPAWKNMRSSEKGLWDMAHGEGQELLSDAYERGLQGIKGQLASDAVSQIPSDVAKKAGINVMRTPKIPRTNARSPLGGRPAVEPPPLVEVPTRDLIDALPGLKKTPEFRRSALDAIDETMGRVGAGLSEDFTQLRRGYMLGKGWREFAESGGFLANKSYDAAKAQAALTKHYADTLSPRGMQDVKRIVEGPIADTPIQRKTMAGPLATIGGILGLVGGGTAGHLAGPLGAVGGAGLAAGFGAHHGARVGSHIPRYTNVPAMLPESARRFTPEVLQAIQQQIQRLLRDQHEENAR